MSLLACLAHITVFNEGTEKPHMDKYKEITNDWNYVASCMLTSLPVSDLENLKCLIFVAECALVCRLPISLFDKPLTSHRCITSSSVFKV
jgi:hypothetical protein